MDTKKAARELSALGVKVCTKPRRKQCLFCSGYFTAYHGKAKYCSAACRVKAFNAKHREGLPLSCANHKLGSGMKLYLEKNFLYCIECAALIGKLVAKGLYSAV
ncbi:MAG: hypothetical protein M1421_03020 [Candidatus Eremiobacteraeota bacterium]|jgi:NAD-dependent dihydropyrimidine dehydrogenase PreA subunit|nr:hypothetical protein [Candidatus Eremiobacteraeota bacterium]